MLKANADNYVVNKELYEEFHKNTCHLKSIPKSSDFAMINHLPIYSKYICQGQYILDIGCGAGPMSLYAASRGATVRGIDLSEKAILENKFATEYHKLKNLTFECSDFMAYSDESVYDIIMLTEVLEHLPDDKAALNKIYELLIKNGHLLISVPSINAPLHKKYLKKYGKDPFDERVGHLRRYDAVSIFNLLHEAGFQLIEFKFCEGYLRNWLYNDRVGSFFMKFNRWIAKRIVTFLDNYLFTPLFGESDIIIVAQKR